jgi:WD repeat-containing protein 45
VLACPGVTKGNVRVELYDMRKSSIIPAHESELSQIALNLDGTRLATASDKGTLIRVFDTHTGDILKELRSVVGEYARSMHGVYT